MEAVVYDYDCFRTGAAYSDARNVAYGLEGAAREAFFADYGPLDMRQKPFDDVLSLLEGIQVAARREQFPGWARPLLDDVHSGALARSLEQALALIK